MTCGSRREVSRPTMRMLPERGALRPAMVLQSVLLPMPLRPTTASTPCVDRHGHALNGVALAVIDLKVLDLQRRRMARALSHDGLRDRLPAPRGSSSISSGVPSLNMRPLCIIVTYSVTRSATSRSCSMMM